MGKKISGKTDTLPMEQGWTCECSFRFHKLTMGRIEYCALHKAAPKFLSLLQKIERGACLQQLYGDNCYCYPCVARAAIAAATGGQP